jgi:hypothetical protein|tara:strand:+ start:1773 stop:2000 length:228 start_codon:yes stop_codon:yes gene_type:complete
MNKIIEEIKQLRIVSVTFETTVATDVTAKLDDGTEAYVFEYYNDELHFSEQDLIGLTLEGARNLKYKRDRAYLQS